jgi:hypothetical protein
MNDHVRSLNQILDPGQWGRRTTDVFYPGNLLNISRELTWSRRASEGALQRQQLIIQEGNVQKNPILHQFGLSVGARSNVKKITTQVSIRGVILPTRQRFRRRQVYSQI